MSGQVIPFFTFGQLKKKMDAGEGEAFALYPPGDYRGTIEDCVLGTSRAQEPKLQLSIKIDMGPGSGIDYRGKKITGSVSLKESATFGFTQLVAAVGAEGAEGDNPTTEMFIGKYIIFNVTAKEWEGEKRNQIGRFRKANGH